MVSTKCPPAPTLLSLPAEVRLSIYTHLFGTGTVVLDAGNHGAGPTALVSGHAWIEHRFRCSAQLLRTCRAILVEARPVLYSSTTFHVLDRTYAGRLPVALCSSSSSEAASSPTATGANDDDDDPARNDDAGHGGSTADPTSARHVRRLIWQLNCDILMHFYASDVSVTPAELASLDELELRCRAETWRVTDRAKCVGGEGSGRFDVHGAMAADREQLLACARALLAVMRASDGGADACLLEFPAWASKGELRLQLLRAPNMAASSRLAGVAERGGSAVFLEPPPPSLPMAQMTHGAS